MAIRLVVTITAAPGEVALEPGLLMRRVQIG